MQGFPFRHGYYGWHEIPRDQRTVAEILVENGYATGLIADTPHLFKPNMNYSQGFMTFHHIRGQTSDNWKVGPWSAIQELLKDYFGDYVPRAPDDLNAEFYAEFYAEGQLFQYLHNIRDRKKESDWFAPQVFGSACRWIRENAANSPFFSLDRLFRDTRDLRSARGVHHAL